jgi:ABC-type Mn2+/Zn2+ transport system permease subunit
MTKSRIQSIAFSAIASVAAIALSYLADGWKGYVICVGASVLYLFGYLEGRLHED